jgi:hypothetical protein
LHEKFGSHEAEAQQHARKNAAGFVSEFRIQLEILESKKSVNPEKLAETQKHPQFSALLQQTILNAAQTDSEAKYRLLAKLIALRLASSSENTITLASQLASDAISRSTSGQLKLMALYCFLEDIRPRSTLASSGYRKWIGIHLKPFIDFEFDEHEVWHLVAIACASFAPPSERNLELLLQMKGGLQCLETTFEGIPEVEVLQISWNLGLVGVHLTSVGSIVGGLALGQINGTDYGMPDWD